MTKSFACIALWHHIVQLKLCHLSLISVKQKSRIEKKVAFYEILEVSICLNL